MALENIERGRQVSGEETAEEMARYGITRVPAHYFYYKQFRYTNLKDAITEAERDQRRAS